MKYFCYFSGIEEGKYHCKIPELWIMDWAHVSCMC